MDSVPWLLSLPLGVSILPSILLAGCPDREADQAAGKRTLVVMLGKRGAIRLAMARPPGRAGACGADVADAADMAALLSWSAAGGAVHAVWLWRRLRRLPRVEMPERIDGADRAGADLHPVVLRPAAACAGACDGIVTCGPTHNCRR